MKKARLVTLLVLILSLFTTLCSCKKNDSDANIDDDFADASSSAEKNEPEEVLHIGKQRQVLWDDYIIDNTHTTAALSVNNPQAIETPIFTFDAAWEGDSCDYFNIISIPQADGTILYRMYYNGWNLKELLANGTPSIKICAIESKDGVNWYRPDYGLYPYGDNNHTNIVLMTEVGFDNFFVFIDTNPNCPAEQKYKAVSEYLGQDDYGNLYGYTSPDGLNWTLGPCLATTADGTFDSVNTCFYNEADGKYYLYFRGFHDSNGDGKAETRDIRMMKADTFDTLSAGIVKILEYNDEYDFALYTNNAMKYYRAPQTIMAIPTRYNDHDLIWTKNYDTLPDSEIRAVRYAKDKRSATVTTDSILMVSHDGMEFSRFAEAFATAGPEHNGNWIYGDCYFAYGMIETPTEFSTQDNVLSMYAFEGKFSDKPSRLYRWTMRIDGFASYKADFSGKTLTTKPFTFDGSVLKLNFKTSGAGSISVKVLDENGQEILKYITCPLFGDKVDRVVSFENGDIAELKGKTIKLQFTMADAEIYSFIIE